MYSFLRGELIEVTDNACVLDVNGVGYYVYLTRKDASVLLNKQNQEVTVYVELIVREDSHTLYGFSHKNNKDVFKILIQLNGIGPKLAAVILSDLSPEELSKAILTNDIVKLTSISGIGKKTAERMIIDLKDKLHAFNTNENLSISSTNSNNLEPKVEEELTSALLALGYRSHEIKRMLQDIKKEQTSEVSLEDLIKTALRASFK